jgi:peptidoglycan-associated lipoprotein
VTEAEPKEAVATPVHLVDPPPALKPPDATEEAPRDSTTIIYETNGQLRDAFFDYDRSAVRPDAVAALEHDARLLAPLMTGFPEITVTIEGHCDERGSAEYNLGLGDHRARSAAEVLSQFGIAAARVRVVSFGKETPQCAESSEACWQRNRRAHLVIRTGAGAE